MLGLMCLKKGGGRTLRDATPGAGKALVDNGWLPGVASRKARPSSSSAKGRSPGQ